MQTYSHGTLVIVIDCTDLARAATFWSGALGYHRPHPQSGAYLMLIPDRGGVEVLLQEVPDTKVIKNRLHIDLRTPNLTAEVDRVLALGASQLTDQPLIEHDWQWHVLADPDGSEFCILQPPNDFPWPEAQGP